MDDIVLQARPTEDAAIVSASIDPIDAFIFTLDRSPKTRETYRRGLRSWTRYLDANGIGFFEATDTNVIEYKRDLADTHKASTVNSYLTALRRFYAFMERKKVCPNIAAGITSLKHSKYAAKDALTKGQAKDLLSVRPETLAEKRNLAIVSLMIRAGLRTIEVVRADCGDFRQQNNALILYVQGKGYTTKEDYVVITDEAAEPIWRYLDARREAGEHIKDDSPLFASTGNRNHGGRITTRTVSRVVKQALEAEGIGSARLTAHSLRHTAVTFALSGGADLQSVQAMARHKSINTTMIYAHNLNRMATAAERNIETYLAS